MTVLQSTQHGKHVFQPPQRSRGWEVEGDHGEWVPVDRATESLLRAAQSKGEVRTEISCGERRYSVTFRSTGEAERVNLQTKVRRRMRDATAGISKDARCSSVVNTLTNLGFAEEKVRQVLDRNGGDLSKALDELTSRGAGGASSSSRCPKFGNGDKQRLNALDETSCATAPGPSSATAAAGPLWQVYVKNQWTNLDEPAQEVLNKAAKKGQNKAVLSNNSNADLVQMVHINNHTGRKRPLRFSGDLEATFKRIDLPNSVAGGKAAMPSRYQVFLEGSGWKTMSLKNSASIEESVRQGKTIFETEDNGCKYRVNLEALTISNLSTGQTTSVRPLEETASDSPAGAVTPQVNQAVVFSRYFSALTGSEKAALSLPQEAAVSQWLAKALTETSEMAEGRELVLAEAEQLFQRLSLFRPSVVSRDEWLHYWMLDSSAPSHYALTILQDELRKLVRKEAPKVVDLMLQLFLQADADADGEISNQDMARCCKKCCQNSWDMPLEGAKKWLARGRKTEDGTLNYFEFVSELIGRQQHDVWLYQYDISGGLAAWAAPVAMFQSVEGIWHTGIIVFGKEYWYGGQCFESKPESTPFGTPLKRSYLGATLCTQAELWDKMDRELCREYTRESYDVLQHNCNNFSDEVAMFLLNKHIPDEVRLQPQQFTQSLAAQALRPVLNRWLGGFEAATMKGLEEARASDLVKAEDAWRQISVGSLVEYSREGLPSLRAEVIAKEEGTCDLWWWEPSGMRHGRFQEAANVSKMQVKDLQRHTGRRSSRRAVVESTNEGCVIC